MSLELYKKVANRIQYDPLTGVMLWKYDEHAPKVFNTRFAGKIAGSKSKKDGRQIGVMDRGVYCYLSTRRLAYFILHGYLPDIVETVNGDPNDDSANNLRIGTALSLCKKRKIQSRKKLKIANVIELQNGVKRFVAQISNGVKPVTKSFLTLPEAENWLNQKKQEFGYDINLHGRS